MISWGTRYDLVGEFSEVQPEICKICTENSTPVYIADRSYFTLYGLPLFPTGKLFYKSCSECNTKLKVKQTDLNLPSVKRALPGTVKFKYIWGWIIVIPILLFLYYLYTIVRK